ncbi:hypothetical protein JCM3770_001974 [Rhodotorula araucariae]
MSSATTPIGVPKHSPNEGDHALTFPSLVVLPPPDDSLDATARPSQAPSAYAAVTRALAGMFAFMFKRPIRLFRPVKISTWAGIQAIAEEQGRSVTPGFVRGLLRKEGWRFIPKHILPPLAINATIGLTLFTSYTTSEALLSAHFFSPAAKFLLIPFISGSLAGAAQSLLSAPLDNARLLLLRRQRFLRLTHADSRNPRLRRSAARLQPTGAAAALAGTPFVSWWILIRDSVFQSARTAGIGGAASATARERLEQGRRWARRGWSLFGLSLVKDSVGFGIFFVIFEVGREASRIGGLAWDGIDPDRAGIGDYEGETLKQRRTPSGLVLQSLGILISGGVAGWIFSLVARPFERMRGAIWEGRARWAERDGRLKVIEELALAGRDPLAHTPASGDTAAGQHSGRRRKTSAGGASERRGNALLGPTGRKEFRVRVGRIRAVSRSAARSRRRKARASERARLLRAVATQAPGSPTAAAAGPQLPPPQARLPMPSAPSLVRAACARYGARTFLFAPRMVLQSVDARTVKPSPLVKPLPVRPPKVGPTRLSARGRQAAEEVKKQASGKGWRRGVRILSYIPPYAVGFFMYALTSGDLKIEV